jgi:N-acetylmuramoyl-L-alanine amidase
MYKSGVWPQTCGSPVAWLEDALVSEIIQGDVCVAVRDIVVEGGLAFSRGEQVVVERIEPDSRRPEFKYVVMSGRLGTRYALSDADIVKPEPAVARAPGSSSSRKALALVAGLAAFAVVAVITGLFVFGGGHSGVGRSPTGAVVCLDPGHGGTDTGALENGVAEKDVNLDIALRARGVLESMGYRVVMTRETDVPVSLATRCGIANNAGAAVLVSVHNNAKPPDVQGTTTYYCRGSSEGARLAQTVQSAVASRIERPDRGIRGSRLYMVRNALMPAALLEGVFLTDAREARLIQDAGFRQRVANGVAAGVDDYLKR